MCSVFCFKRKLEAYSSCIFFKNTKKTVIRLFLMFVSFCCYHKFPGTFCLIFLHTSRTYFTKPVDHVVYLNAHNIRISFYRCKISLVLNITQTKTKIQPASKAMLFNIAVFFNLHERRDSFTTTERFHNKFRLWESLLTLPQEWYCLRVRWRMINSW